jgi:hypothetical protein
MGGFAAPISSDPVPAPSSLDATTPQADALDLVGQLQMSRNFLPDREFANVLRNNDMQLADRLGRYGWHGSWRDDADYIADFDRVARAIPMAVDDEKSPLILTSGISAGAANGPGAAGPTRAPPTAPLRPPGQLTPDPRIGSYRQVAGDHVHQVAARTAGPGAKRASAPQYRDALSHATTDPTYNDPAGQLVEGAINFAAHGADYNDFPASPGGRIVQNGRVLVRATGATDLGRTRTATPSPWFEDIKSFYKLLEAGKTPTEAVDLVFASANQLAGAGATVQRVPEAPRAATKLAKAGQRLSLETPTRLSGPEPIAAPSRGGRGPGGGAMEAFGVASTLAAVGQTADLLRQGKPFEAAKTAGIAITLTKVLKRFPKLGPLGLALGTLLGYDEHAEDLAMDTGTSVERFAGKYVPGGVAHVAGGVTASGTALGVGFYQGVVKPVGSGIYAGATILKPTHASFPSLGPDSSRFRARIESHKEGCQTCHDAVRVDNWAKDHPEMTRLLNKPGSPGGIPTDELLQMFEANAFPLNERLP